MDIITTIIYLVLFIIMMIFVFSIGMLRTYMPRKEIILVILVAFLIGSIGGALFLEPIYNEIPSVAGVVEKNMPNTDETLYLDLSSSNDINELRQNLSQTEGFKSFEEDSITISLWSFTDVEKAYFEDIIGNIDSHYKNYTVNSSGKIDIEIDDNYSSSQALKSFSDWYKLVYGDSLAYAQIHAKLVIESSAFDQFQQNLLDRGIVANGMEGPIQSSIDSHNSTTTMSSTKFVLITGALGVIVALIGIYFDSVVVYYRRLRKFSKEKKKR